MTIKGTPEYYEARIRELEKAIREQCACDEQAEYGYDDCPPSCAIPCDCRLICKALSSSAPDSEVERIVLPVSCNEGCDSYPPPKDCPVRWDGVLADCVGDMLAPLRVEAERLREALSFIGAHKLPEGLMTAEGWKNLAKLYEQKAREAMNPDRASALCPYGCFCEVEIEKCAKCEIKQALKERE